MTQREIIRSTEGILFAAGYAVEYDKLCEVLEIGRDELLDALGVAVSEYGDRGIQLVLYGDACQLCTKEDLEGYIKQALGIRGAGTLSKSLCEVLAIIAYNQPVTRAFIEQVRGVDSSYAVNTLAEKQLIECSGRLDVPGKPMLYVTTDTFLRSFGLSSLDELPKADLLDALNGGTDAAGEDKSPVGEGASEESQN